MSEYLPGIHDPGGAELDADRPGWRVFTEAIGCDPNDHGGGDYSWWADRGYGVIVRLNNGYAPHGTIPTPDRYADFAERVGNFVAASRGCSTWVIGNEPNHSQERPQGQVITAVRYAECFLECDAVKPRGHSFIPAPIAPWNLESGDWLDYMRAVLDPLAFYGAIDGLALHAYTHGADPALVYSDERRHGWLWHFRTYRDQLAVAREYVHNVPVFITECNQGDAPWLNAVSGWVPNALEEIDVWNGDHADQVIRAVCLYRWPNADRWGIESKQGVQDDYRAAVARGYKWTTEEEPMAFDGSFTGTVVEQDGISQLKVISPWRVQWIEGDGTGGILYRPEVDKNTEAKYLPAGATVCQKVWTNHATHDAAIWQQSIAAKGALVRFEINAYQQTNNANNWGWARVGIDPTGGMDMLADTVEWGEQSAQRWGQHVRLAAEAIAQSNTITVFARAAWQYPERWCDTFWSLGDLASSGDGPGPGPGPEPAPGDYEVDLVATIGGLEIPIRGTVRLIEE